MKPFALRLVAQIAVQSGAMIFFMRVAHLNLFVSAALSALLALIVGLALHFILKPKTAPGTIVSR